MLKKVFVIFALIYAASAVLPIASRFRGGMANRAHFWKYGDDALTSGAEAAPAQWFTQTVDHFDSKNTLVWKQKYFVNDTVYQTGGPLFVYIGGEGPLGASSVGDHIIISDWAQQYGALVVALEHRYYGDSYPVPDLSTPNMKYLTSQQALADLANFITSFKAQRNMASAKVVTFGGSYPGCLSAWFREKYPNVVDFAIGTSAPVQAILNFYDYANVVSDSLGPVCAGQVRKANAEIEAMFADPTGAGKAKLQEIFGFCSPMKTAKDVTFFFSSISDPVCEAVQYSGDNNASGRKFGIPQVCEIMNSSPDVVGNLAKVVKTYQNSTGETCLSVSYDDFINEMKSTAVGPNQAGRSWTWQTCVEFGFFQAFEGNYQPFSTRVDLNYFLDMCSDFFGQRMVPDIVKTNEYYGGANGLASRTSKLIVPNGSLDPWHVLGSYDRSNPSVVPIYIEGTAHCADLYPASNQDRTTLTEARTLEEQLLKDFLTGNARE